MLYGRGHNNKKVKKLFLITSKMVKQPEQYKSNNFKVVEFVDKSFSARICCDIIDGGDLAKTYLTGKNF